MRQFKLFFFISFFNENDNTRSNIIACHHQNHASIFMHAQYVSFYTFLYSTLYFVKQSSTFSPWKFTQLPLKLLMIYFSSVSVLSAKWVVASFFIDCMHNCTFIFITFFLHLLPSFSNPKHKVFLLKAIKSHAHSSLQALFKTTNKNKIKKFHEGRFHRKLLALYFSIIYVPSSNNIHIHTHGYVHT